MNRLENAVRSYDWGSTTAIPRLLGQRPTDQPHAELWLGAHPAAPSRLVHDDSTVALDDAIRADSAAMLGRRVQRRFGDRLPYLLKVLAAERPLSLQAHPTAEQAATGYAREEAAGVPRTAPNRSYGDPHHKPEVLLATEPVEALCGFRPVDQTLGLLAGLDARALDPLRAALDERGLRAAVHLLLALPRVRAAVLVDEVAAACAARLAGGSPFPAEDATAVELAGLHPGDPGVVISLLLHRVRLEPGRALYLPAGVLHSYQRGVGIEVMAASDNVLRGGLTSKHVDVDELLAVVRFEPQDVPWVTPQTPSPGVQVLAPGVPEFALTHVVLDGVDAITLPDDGPRIVLCLSGDVQLTATSTLSLRQGQSAFVSDADGPLTMAGTGVVVMASVPPSTQTRRIRAWP